MTKQVSPFTKEELIPQEEKLEIYKNKGELFIGIPKETSYQEKRICLSPDAVGAITAHGHRVMIESGAGNYANFSDKEGYQEMITFFLCMGPGGRLYASNRHKKLQGHHY